MALDFLARVNSWIGDQQALVVTVGVPILTAIVAGLVSWITNRSILRAQAKSRALQREMQLANFRQQWITDLRSDLASMASLELTGLRAKSQDQLADLVEIGSRILMRMNRDDPDFKTLERSIERSVDYFGSAKEERTHLDEKYSDVESIVALGQRIMKREWERLKSDLRSTES